jgi:hypothetical protein
MLNCRWQAIEPRKITAWEATHSAERSLVSGEIALLKGAPSGWLGKRSLLHAQSQLRAGVQMQVSGA